MSVRLKNTEGVVVSVSERTASLLGSGWMDADAKARSETPDKGWKVDDLKSYATEHDIDLGDATKKEDILAVINKPSDD
jgi:hypothetical protein